LQVVAGASDAESPHHGQRHGDVRLRHEIAGDFEPDRRLGQGSGHQQSAEELARYVAAHGSRSAGQARGFDDQRRATGLGLAGDAGAERSQRVDQVANRPLVHARRAVQSIPTRSGGGQQGGEEANRGAAVAHVDLGLGRVDAAAAADEVDRSGRRIVSHVEPQSSEPRDHDARVVAVERSDERRTAVGRRRADQGAIRDAFRARRPNSADDRAGDRLQQYRVGHGWAIFQRCFSPRT